MIIKHAPNSDGSPREVDTDQLPDVPAELLEMSEKFRELCLKYQRQFFLVINIHDSPDGVGHTFWNYKSANVSPEPNKEADTNQKVTLTEAEIKMFYNMISAGVYGVSKGNAALMLRH